MNIWCADAGTVARFLPPLAAVSKGTYTFDASDQLRRRPSQPLLEALRELGVTVRFHGPEHGFPFHIEGHGLAGGEVEVAGSQSSQFTSGLLMAGPSMDVGLTVRTPGLVSVPYVDMTLTLMERCGASISRDDTERFTVQPGRYTTDEIRIEPDASSASYFLAAAVVTGTPIIVEGLGTRSLQGDTRFARVLRELGADLDIAEDSITVHGTARLRGRHGRHGGHLGHLHDLGVRRAAGGGAHPYRGNRPRAAEGVRPHRRGRGQPRRLRDPGRDGPGLDPGLARGGEAHADPVHAGSPHRHVLLGAVAALPGPTARRPGVCEQDIPRLPPRAGSRLRRSRLRHIARHVCDAVVELAVSLVAARVQRASVVTHWDHVSGRPQNVARVSRKSCLRRWSPS